MEAKNNRVSIGQSVYDHEGDHRMVKGTSATLAQSGKGHRLPVEPGVQYAGDDRRGHPVLNPEFALVRSDYRVRLATEESHLHTRARNLVTRMYGSRGLMTAVPPGGDKKPEQVTLAASSGHRVFGTLTLGVDSGKGLLAESLYRPEIEELRTRGHRLCEVTRLALDPELSCPEVMATIFNIAFVLARDVHARTDLLAEVHPRHAGFYRRTMGYRIAGPVRECRRVRAPAVLMHLCLDFAGTQINRLAGTCARTSRSLYRQFLPPAEQAILLRKLTSSESIED